MKPSYLLLLCIGVRIQSSLSQEMTCTPQEVPEETINCDLIDSVFLTCACNAYKSSILDVMGSLSCLIPGLNFQTNAGTTPSHSTAAPTPAYNDTLSTTVQMLPVTMFSSQRPRGGGSPFGSLLNPQLADMIKNITSKLGEEVFGKICDGIPALQQCVGSGYKQSNKSIDVILRTFFNFDNLRQVLTSVCDLKAEIFSKVDCLTDAALPMSACVGLSLTGGFLQQSSPDMNAGEFSLNTYCPIAGDVARCISIQAKTCSTQLGTTIRGILPNLLSQSCGQLAAAGTNNPIMSTPMMCSLPIMPRALSVIDTFSTGTQSAAEINELVGDMIDVYCGEISDIMTCMNEELPSSMNSMDNLIKALVDVNQLAYGDTLANYMCRPSRVQEMKEALPCLMSKENEIGACVNPQQGLNLNFSAIGMDEARDRRTYCGPINSIMNCAVDNVLATCNADLAASGRDVYLTLMRTDCNGVRTGELQGLIAAQRQDTTEDPLGTATSLSKLSILTLTLLVIISSLLL